MINNQKIIKELIAFNKEGIEQQGKLLEIIKTMDSTDNKLFDHIKILYRYIAVLNLFIGFFLWKIFLWAYINLLFSRSIYFWTGLSEGYKILILSLLGSIPTGVIIAISTHFIIKKIDVKKE